MGLGKLARLLFGIDEMGEESRNYVIENCKEGIDPRTAITDFGDYDGDTPSTDKAARRDADGIGYSTIEEVKAFYDTTRYTGIKIVTREDK